MDQGVFLLVLVVAAVAFVVLVKTAIVVPQQSAFIVERLGKYSSTLNAGFHILVPFIERIAYRHGLKESAIDIAEQICITRDNVQVGIDGVLYLQVMDPARASYGIADYTFAITQLAQTTLRSEIGKIELDRTFEERGKININVVSELDKASEPWGVKVLRYEIKNINPPRDVIQAMEKQMRAEREKRAVILTSEGERDAKINQAEGEKQRVIKESEANRQQQINEAAGEAEAILAVATATARRLAARRRCHRRRRRPRGDAATRRRELRAAIRQSRAHLQHSRHTGERQRHRGHDRDGDEGFRPVALRRGWCSASLTFRRAARRGAGIIPAPTPRTRGPDARARRDRTGPHPVRAQHELPHPVPGRVDRPRLGFAVLPHPIHARPQRGVGVRVLLLGQGLRADVRARRRVGRHDELSVRHELARLHRARRQHHGAVARLRGADGVFHRGDVPRHHAVRQGPRVERHASHRPPRSSPSARRCRRSGS